MEDWRGPRSSFRQQRCSRSGGHPLLHRQTRLKRYRRRGPASPSPPRKERLDGHSPLPRERTGSALGGPYKTSSRKEESSAPYVRDVAQSVGLHEHLRAILGAVRRPGSASSSCPTIALTGDPNLAHCASVGGVLRPGAPELPRCERVGPGCSTG